MSTERPWLAHYGASTQPEIGALPYRSLGEMISAVAQTYGHAPAFTNVLPNGMNGTLSFAQADEMSDAFAVYLREVAGLTAGDRVALQMPNALGFPVAAFGILKAGCVLVNVNPLYTAEEMARQFADAQPKALVIIDMFADKIAEATQAHNIEHVIVTRVAEFFPTLPRAIVGLVQRVWDKSVKPIETPHIRLPEAIAQGRAKGGDAARYGEGLTPETLACLQYTGGTTGVAKGAMLTHGNLLSNKLQVMQMIGAGVKQGDEVALTALPMYHIFAFTVNLLGFYWLGARNILIPSPRPLGNLRRAFENYKITWMSGVNTLFNGLNNEMWFTDNPPKHLKFCSAGGMALQGAVAERWEAITGKPVLQGYGLTETSPVLTFNPLGRTREGCIGIPVPSTDMACVDEDGMPVPQGERGEIAAKGAQVMSGYWNNPDETAKVMKNGWFLTGDIGVMDPDGYFRIVDRKKDMVVVSGFNVYPNEVEDCLATHPGILESAVIGVPDAATGELVKAFVVKRDAGLSAADVRGHCKEHLTAYKVPKLVEFRDELPKSNVGKILRKDLRAEELARGASSAQAAE
jgi:long-chain acyl-CoA synthetase